MTQWDLNDPMMTHGDLQFPNDAPLGSTDDPRGSDDDPMGPTNDPLNRPRESEYFYSLSELNSGVEDLACQQNSKNEP